MWRAVIIEDELNARAGLRKMLKILMPDLKIIGETGFVSKGVLLIENEKPDLVFLDIELEDGTGFDLLNQLKSTSFKIVFTTAYNKYAINAFKFSAVDYLLKPIDPMELKAAIDRALFSIENEKQRQNLLEILKENIEKEEQKIVINTTENCHVIPLKNIIRLMADGAYTIFITINEKIIVSKNIKYYQNLLDDSFIRCHQSHLVNTKHITRIEKKDFLRLSNSDLIPISVRKRASILPLKVK